MQQARDSGRNRDGSATERSATAQDTGGNDEKIEHEHPIGAGPQAMEGAGAGHDGATGGETWNQTLGGNTAAGTRRMLLAIALFILAGAFLFWLAAG